MKKRNKAIKIPVDSYSGVKSAISKLLESGRVIKFQSKSTMSDLKKLDLNIKALEKKKQEQGRTTYEDKKLENLSVQTFYKIMGVSGGKITEKAETGMSMFNSRLILNVPAKSSSQKSVAPFSINTLQDLLNNWENVEKEMLEHDVRTHNLNKQYAEYEEWKNRFKEAAGLGLTNDRIFAILDALEVNRHHLFTLQGYLVKEAKEGRNYDLQLDNLDMSIFNMIHDIMTTKGDKLDEDDIEAIEVLTRIRDQIL